MNFQTLGLVDSLLDAINSSGYTTPTPIQAQAIPAILSGQDVMAAAQTGTGKTAGFTLPLLQRLGKQSHVSGKQVRALVLTPTRELAAQVSKSIDTYGRNERLRSQVVFGGVNISPQRRGLAQGVDILVATPGRLLDLYQQKAVKFDELEILVLDEADRMLDMGFIRDIRRILPLLPKERQNLMFSATFSNDIRQLARGLCQNPVEIDVAPRNSTVESIEQHIYQVKKEDKSSLLSHLLRQSGEQVLVFSRTKHGADKLVKRLDKDGVQAAAIHGNKSQAQRTKALNSFKRDRVQVLVATDIAARGIDIQALSLVINFDLPNVEEDYVHRIGRTGRAGASGRAISLVGPDEKKLLRDIERFIQRKIERAELPDFERGEILVDGANSSARAASAANPGSRQEAQRPRQRSQQNGNRRRQPSGDSGKQFSNRPSRHSQQRGDAAANEEGRQGGQRKPRRNPRSNQNGNEFQPQQQRARGQRNQEQRGQAQRGQEQRGQSQRSQEQRGQEQRGQSQRGQEQRGQSQRGQSQRGQESWSQQRSARRDEQSGNRAPSSGGSGRRRQSTGARSSGSTVSRISRFFSGGKRSARG